MWEWLARTIREPLLRAERDVRSMRAANAEDAALKSEAMNAIRRAATAATEMQRVAGWFTQALCTGETKLSALQQGKRKASTFQYLPARGIYRSRKI